VPYRPPIDLPDGLASTRLQAAQVPAPDALITALEQELGSGAVAVDEATLTQWSRDWWPLAITWALQQQVPARASVVVHAQSDHDIAATIRLAADHAVPVTVAAGRSGVCGGAIPIAGGIVLDVTALDAVIDIDDASLTLSVQPGVFGDVLEATLQDRGYTLGHWPQSIEMSTVGGWIACRGAGQYSTRYGKIEDMVVGLDVVDGSGHAIRTGGWPRAAVGPDLTQVFVGSEGTLGVVTAARLRLHPKPAADARLAFGMPTFAAGLDVCRRVLRRGATPACLRLYDTRESQRSYEVDTNVLLVLDEGDPAIVDAMVAVAREECEATPGSERLDDSLVDKWLSHRNDVSALEKVVRAGIVVETIEISAPWAALPAIYDDGVAALSGVEGSLVASAHCSHSYGDGGCLYFTFAGRVGDDLDAKDAFYKASFDGALGAVMARGGAISHHHGVGLNRAHHVRAALGEGAFAVLTGLKRQLDPRGILNPGKLGLPSPFLPEGWSWG
jgi:alkyldihydroxyacetonephosphate synthase